MRKATLCVALLAILACSSSAAILGLAGGTLPPSTYNPLGGWPMTAFNPDGRPTSGFPVSDVPSPIAGLVSFSVPLGHYLTPGQWGTWSHGYVGDVYYAAQGAVDLTMPAGTNAFYLYAEPNTGVYNITATALGGAVLTQTVSSSSGASYYGLWCTAGDTISSIAMTSAADFAIGEFGINQTLQDGDLLIEKIIGYGDPPGTPWEFWVEPENGEPYLVTIAGGGGQLLLEDLEPGIYTIIETPVESWQTVVASSDPGAIFGPYSATISIEAGGRTNVTFTNTLVPEPCTLTLLGLGLLGALRRRRSQR